MFEDEEERNWKHDPVTTGGILLLSLISPVGAPLLGWLAIVACDIPWEGEYQCIVPDAVLTYLIGSLFIPLFWFGYFGLAWLLISLAVTIGFLLLFVSAAWAAFADWW